MDGLAPVFWQNTLPLMVTIVVAVFGASLAGWASNKNLAARIDDLRSDMNRRFDDVNRRLERIESNWIPPKSALPRSKSAHLRCAASFIQTILL